jgi:glycosyltransferase involved in cell wall biosynthesis
MPLVSVIIPAFNAEAFIARAIDSILRQTEQDFEIIVSDDGSRDATAAQVARYAHDDRVKYISHANRGASHAKNLAARQARGEYLAFLDSDDLFAPTALETMIRQTRAAHAVWCFVDVIKKIGEREELRRTDYPAGDPLLGLLAQDYILVCPFYLRTEFLAIGGFDESLAVREDWDINIRMMLAKKPFAYIAEPLYTYTRTENSLMTGSPRRVLSCTERLLRKHHKPLADSGNREIGRIYAQNMWGVARQYFYDLHDVQGALRCGRESLRYDLNLRRLVHPLIHKVRSGSKARRQNA